MHTRVSERLSEDIRGLAEELRVPVSNLVRNVLEEAFSVVERVSDDVGDLLENVLDEAERAAERLHRHRARREAREARGAWDDEEPRPDEGVQSGSEGIVEAELGRGSGPSLKGAAASSAEAAREADPLHSVPDFRAVLAWQPVVLNAPQGCARTGRSIAAGQEAFMGMTAQGFSGHFLSHEGLEVLRADRG